MTTDDRNAVAVAAKSGLRRAARVRISAMTAGERDAADAAVCTSLAELATQAGATFVVGYLALADEVRLDAFLAECAGRSLETLVPRVVAPREIALVRWEPGCALSPDLERVPSPEEPAAWPAGAGLLVVPGRVFDTEGGRVGRGLGYYDRFLGSVPSTTTVVGAAYECQVVDRVPREPHDAGVAWLATETGLRRCAEGASKSE